MAADHSHFFNASVSFLAVIGAIVLWKTLVVRVS